MSLNIETIRMDLKSSMVNDSDWKSAVQNLDLAQTFQFDGGNYSPPLYQLSYRRYQFDGGGGST